jgi:hypothetical protein
VIRSYRNLIHPGRVVRLREVIDEDSAKVAASLVNMVIRDVAQSARSSYGFTAETIVQKIRNDPSSTRVLKYLLEQTNDIEKERLLLRILPSDYTNEVLSSRNDLNILVAIQECFQLCWSLVGEDVKEKVARDYVRRVEQDDQERIQRYDLGLFHPGYLKHLSGRDYEMVKQHIFPLVGEIPLAMISPRLGGLAQYVQPEEVYDFGNPLISRYIAEVVWTDRYDSDACRADTTILNFIVSEYFWLSAECQKQFDEMLEKWVGMVSDTAYKASLLEELKSRITIGDDLPF